MHTVLVEYRAQLPFPLHAPVRLQLAGPSSGHIPRGSLIPSATGRQMPTAPTWAQLRHAPSHAESQHTPSTQKPLVHSIEVSQVAPSSLVPQLPATHWRPLTHWSDVSQREKQWGGTSPSCSHAKGAQLVTGPISHCPSPSQARAAVMLLPSHRPAAQRLPAGYLRQTPWPSQVPSKPHVLAP
jgi:hypothetical protein